MCMLCFVPTGNLLSNAFHSARLDKVVEALVMCNFDKVQEKYVSYSKVCQEGRQKVRGDAACRYSSDKDWAILVEHRCVAEDADRVGKVLSCPKHA